MKTALKISSKTYEYVSHIHAENFIGVLSSKQALEFSTKNNK
jgi:hypothetical protein